MFRKITALLLLMVTYGQCQADDSFQLLVHAKSLKCQFTSSCSGLKEKSGIKPRGDTTDTFSFNFDSINLISGTARIIGNLGSDDVGVSKTGNGLLFVETTPSGNQNFTTVFGSELVGIREFSAVHSMHRDPNNSFNLPCRQFYGTCKIWD